MDENNYTQNENNTSLIPADLLEPLAKFTMYSSFVVGVMIAILGPIASIAGYNLLSSEIQMYPLILFFISHILNKDVVKNKNDKHHAQEFLVIGSFISIIIAIVFVVPTLI